MFFNDFCSGKRPHRQFVESDSKTKVDKHEANRSFTSATEEKEIILKRQRSQSYTEGKGKANTVAKKYNETGMTSKCGLDEEFSRNDDELIETKLDNAILDNVVREGRYFLGENLGRITRDIDGSRNEIDTLDDDQLEWDDDPDLTAS